MNGKVSALKYLGIFVLVNNAGFPKRSARQCEISTNAGISSFPTFFTNSVSPEKGML